MILDRNVKEQIKELLLRKNTEMEKRVTVISAYQLESDELANLKKYLSKTMQMTIQNKIDPAILGGFVIQYGSKMIDLSLRGRLQQLRQILYENT